MNFELPTPTQLPFGLRALMTVARADGDLAEPEAAVLVAAQQTFGSDLPLDSIDTIAPAELADAIPEPGIRFQLFGALVVMAMADGEVNDVEAEVVARFAEALAIEDAAVRFRADRLIDRCHDDRAEACSCEPRTFGTVSVSPVTAGTSSRAALHTRSPSRSASAIRGSSARQRATVIRSRASRSP